MVELTLHGILSTPFEPKGITGGKSVYHVSEHVFRMSPVYTEEGQAPADRGFVQRLHLSAIVSTEFFHAKSLKSHSKVGQSGVPMFKTRRLVITFLVILNFYLLTPQLSSAQERLCDPSFEDCYTPLIQLINAETVGIDMSFYMIELPGLADAVIARYRAGVPVRLVVEPRGNLKFPMN